MSEPERRDILAELRRRGFRASRRRGQNFLFDPQLLDALIDDTDLPDRSRIVEIGAGAGTLTRRILAEGHRVVSVEIDSILGKYLRESLQPRRTVDDDTVDEDPAGNSDLTLVLGDVLATKNRLSSALLGELAADDAPIHLVANLPYAIATPVVQLLLELERPILDSVGVLVQAEAAARWSAVPGNKDYGAISVSLSLLGDGRVSRRVGRHLFSPPPQVESAFFVWKRAKAATLSGGLGRGHRVAKRLFRQRRKMLRAIIGSTPGAPIDWDAVAIDPTARPEQLAPEEFVRLAARLSNEDWKRLGVDP